MVHCASTEWFQQYSLPLGGANQRPRSYAKTALSFQNFFRCLLSLKIIESTAETYGWHTQHGFINREVESVVTSRFKMFFQFGYERTSNCSCFMWTNSTSRENTRFSNVFSSQKVTNETRKRVCWVALSYHPFIKRKMRYESNKQQDLLLSNKRLPTISYLRRVLGSTWQPQRRRNGRLWTWPRPESRKADLWHVIPPFFLKVHASNLKSVAQSQAPAGESRKCSTALRTLSLLVFSATTSQITFLAQCTYCIRYTVGSLLLAETVIRISNGSGWRGSCVTGCSK